jgi:hypothetical protein
MQGGTGMNRYFLVILAMIGLSLFSTSNALALTSFEYGTKELDFLVAYNHFAKDATPSQDYLLGSGLFGYFLAPMHEIGAKLDLARSWADGTSVSDLYALPHLFYALNMVQFSKAFVPYVGAELGYSIHKQVDDSSQEKWKSGTSWGLFGGGRIFMVENVGIKLELAYDQHSFGTDTVKATRFLTGLTIVYK